ncbi:Bud-site selection protein [Calycina marina]|uniref:Bud-site selection protein n=1 Tax=Calycina marina TaxID=1763456 RepID=A0A9P7Z1H8_9HELO|nr:Bud-site selection protein [Calycina marina]
MVKRKRPNHGDENGERAQKHRKKEVSEKVIQSKKLLNRSLKTAKGFERQKLGKRLKNATQAGKYDEVARINREIEVLKGMELGVIVEGHLWKSLGKVKAFAENEELAEAKRVLKEEEELPEMTEDEKKAWGNVTSGLFNMKSVKDAMVEIVRETYAVLGISPPSAAKRQKGTAQELIKPIKGILKSASKIGSKESGVLNAEESDWEGIGSGDNGVPIPGDADSESESDEEDNGARLGDDDFDDEMLERYQNLLGSSDEESFDEAAYKARRTSPPSTNLSLSPSSSPSISLSLSDQSEVDSGSDSDSEAIAIAPRAKKTKRAAKPDELNTSTFLPTLMGGYWSGSESSASDIENDPKMSLQTRKNRPGQMARRAIWEKKFKDKANHVKTGQGTVEEVRQSKRKDEKGLHRGRGGGRGRGGWRERGDYAGGERRREVTTGDNATPLGDRRPKPKNDDAGVLHPSWQAAKKAKKEQKTATFAGRKVVFD